MSESEFISPTQELLTRVARKKFYPAPSRLRRVGQENPSLALCLITYALCCIVNTRNFLTLFIMFSKLVLLFINLRYCRIRVAQE